MLYVARQASRDVIASDRVGKLSKYFVERFKIPPDMVPCVCVRQRTIAGGQVSTVDHKCRHQRQQRGILRVIERKRARSWSATNDNRYAVFFRKLFPSRHHFGTEFLEMCGQVDVHQLANRCDGGGRPNPFCPIRAGDERFLRWPASTYAAR